MSERKRKPELKALVEKYQRFTVVSEIEKNLSSSKRASYPPEVLIPSVLYSESNYDLDCYSSLEESIKQDGFLMPLIICSGKKENTFEIINGIKRFMIGKKLGLTSFPCVFVDLTPERKEEYIIENIFTEGDSPLVKTYCFKLLKKDYGFTDETLAEKANISVNQVRNLIRLDSLPNFIKSGIKSFLVSYGEARALLNLPLETQKELYEDIQESKVSVRDLEKLKRNYHGRKRKTEVFLKGKTVTIKFTTKEKAQKAYPRISKSFSD